LCAFLIAAASLTGRAAPHVVIHVDDDAAPGGDGSGRLPFDNLPDALAAARLAEGRAMIVIKPGDYEVPRTLVIDRAVELRGSTELIQGPDGWPTGDVVAGTATRVFASDPSMARLLLVDQGTSVVSDVVISGFIFEGTVDGISILLNRAQGFRIAANVFRAPANFGVQSVASSGVIIGNHFSGVGTGAIVAGGFPASPSNVIVQGNRAVRNRLGGVLLNGASINIPELGDEVHVVVRDNDLSDNTGAQGFGVRAFILRRDPGAPGDSQSSANVHASIVGNRLAGNRFGIVIDAGFPFRITETGCDPRVFSGTMDLRFAGNTVSSSLRAPSMVTFTRHSAALSPSTLEEWQYLHSARFTIDDSDETLASAWIDHPSSDPFVGPCPGDAVSEPLGNSLIYNGRLLPNGKTF
jgi:hypothetical protein